MLLDLDDRIMLELLKREDGLGLAELGNVVNSDMLGLGRGRIVDSRALLVVLQRLKGMNRVYRVGKRVLAVRLETV
jgi:hypothetical protein